MYFGCDLMEIKTGDIVSFDEIKNDNHWPIWTRNQKYCDKSGAVASGFKFKEIKPILRPLSSMTEEEIIEVAILADCLPTGWREADHYKVAHLDHPNEGIEVCVLKKYSVRITKRGAVYFYNYDKPSAAIFIPTTFEIIRYLLSKHFDLFGLIESGLAVDKTKIK